MLKQALTAICILAAAVLITVPAAAETSMQLEPQQVLISAFYNGTTIKVTGRIPADTDALVRLNGEGEEVHLKKKGKAAGILWMNIGDVTFAHTPRAFMLYGGPDGGKSVDHLVGFAALEKEVEISPATEDKSLMFNEFIKMKQSQGIYGRHLDVVRYGTPDGDGKTFTVDITIPPRMTPGQYLVKVFAVRDRQVVDQAGRNLEIKEVGFPARLASLAFDHALLYGVMAVLIALAAGLFIGIVFKDKGGAH
ncbi:MAG: TIGR02186 family protein [Desulfobacterales bacterium]|nr:TIGR02186 family protein [Desulfobacterales bacterium]